MPFGLSRSERGKNIKKKKKKKKYRKNFAMGKREAASAN